MEGGGLGKIPIMKSGVKYFQKEHSYSDFIKKFMTYLSLQMIMYIYLVKVKVKENMNSTSEFFWTHCVFLS